MVENNYKYLSINNAVFIDENMYFAEVLTNEIYKYDIANAMLVHIGGFDFRNNNKPFTLKRIFRQKTKVIWIPDDSVDYVVLYDTCKEKLYKKSVGKLICASGAIYYDGKVYIVPKYIDQPLIEVVIENDAVICHEQWCNALIKYGTFKSNTILRTFNVGSKIHLQLDEGYSLIYDINGENTELIQSDILSQIQYYGITKFGSLIYFEGHKIKELNLANYQIINEFECDESIISRIYAIDENCMVWNEHEKRFSLYSIREGTLLGRIQAPEHWTTVSGRREKWPLMGSCRLYNSDIFVFPHGANSMLCISDTFESMKEIPIVLDDVQIHDIEVNEELKKNIMVETSIVGLREYIMTVTKS